MSSFSGTSCPARSQTARGMCCRTCLGSGPRDCMSEGPPLRAVYGGLAPFQKRLTSTTASPGTCVKVDLIKNWRPHSSNRFAIELNEVTGVEQGKIPPTDARWGFHISYLDFGGRLPKMVLSSTLKFFPHQVTTGPTGAGGGAGGRGGEHQAWGRAEPEGPEEADRELAGCQDVVFDWTCEDLHDLHEFLKTFLNLWRFTWACEALWLIISSSRGSRSSRSGSTGRGRRTEMKELPGLPLKIFIKQSKYIRRSTFSRRWMFNKKYWEQRERGFQGIQFEPLWWSPVSWPKDLHEDLRTSITNVIWDLTISQKASKWPCLWTESGSCDCSAWRATSQSGEWPPTNRPSSLECTTVFFLGVPMHCKNV